MKRLNTALGAVADVIFPSHCFACGKHLANDAIICCKCFHGLERIDGKVCDVCGMPKDKCECSDRVYHFLKVCSPFVNTGIAQLGVYSLKFKKLEPISHFYSKEMVKCINKRFSDINFDYICYVPTTAVKFLKRGFNQAQLLADDISDMINVPVLRNVLYKNPLSKTQHLSASVSERFKNAGKSFLALRKISCKRILLIDDIKTSGATLDSCAKALLYAGAEEVYCATALISDKTIENNKEV